MVQSLTPEAQQALFNAQQQIDTSGFDQVQYNNPEDWSAYNKAMAELQNIYNPVTTQQATPTNNAQLYQRSLAQAELMRNNGASAAQIAQNLVQQGITDQNTLAEILRQLAA